MDCAGTCVEGTVSYINKDMAYFKLENNIKVHMCISSSYGDAQKLPPVGSYVTITNGHRDESTFVVCHSSVMSGDFNVPCTPSVFLNLIDIYRLGAIDIINFDRSIRRIEQSFNNINDDLRLRVYIYFLQNILFKAICQGKLYPLRNRCQNTLIVKCALTTVRYCKHVEIKSKKYASFPYWSFGVHPSRKDVLLFGYLKIQPVYGFYMIKDSHYQIVCIITTENSLINSQYLSRLQNSYVFITGYTVITEIFNDSNIPSIEYIIVSANNIVPIYSTSQNCGLLDIKPNLEEQYSAFSLVVLKKSCVYIGVHKLPEFVLQCFIRIVDTDSVWDEVFLVITSKYIAFNLFFKEGYYYVLHHKDPLKEINNHELSKIKNLKTYEVPQENCFFEPLSSMSTYKLEAPLPIRDCKHVLQHYSGLLTFQGIIKAKLFMDPLPSRTTKRSAVYGFGTPGPKVHRLVFFDYHNNHNVYLDCYLNNWENSLMPLGLVPQMEVIVKHVIPQSKKYMKSSVITTFEVVAYKPFLPFDTVNLFKNDDIDWGIPIFLSEGKRIPPGVLVWGKVFSIFILKLEINVVCTKCRRVYKNLNNCGCCTEESRQIEFTARFNTLDQVGQGMVSTKSHRVLQLFLNLGDASFEEWCMTFGHSGTFRYNYFDRQSTPMYEYLTKCIENFKERRIVFHLKCRRTGASSNDAARPMWDCIDARKE